MAADGEIYEIMTFCWNTESIRLCETLSKEKKSYNRGTYNTEGWYECEIADFTDELVYRIKNSMPDVFVVSFQEDAYPGSYYHSHLLLDSERGDGIMPDLGYKLIARNTMIGAGVTTYKAAKQADIKGRGLRISVYAREGVNVELLDQREYICDSALKRGKGATATYLKFPNYTISIINTHFPFNAKSLTDYKNSSDPIIRQTAIYPSNICFNNIVRNLVLEHEEHVDMVILMGDLNYRVMTTLDASAVAQELLDSYDDPDKNVIKKYIEFDELRQQIVKKNVYDFLEGIGNQGPLFLPTCKMIKDRNYTCRFHDPAVPAEGKDCWNVGKHEQRTPSWCDRILYMDRCKNHNIVCTYYDRFDYGETMLKSDHAGVIATFQLM